MLEHEAFRIYVNSNYHKVETEHQFSDMIEEFFDIDSGDAEDWDKTKWYCFDCMLVFMKRRAWKWWYQQKQSCEFWSCLSVPQLTNLRSSARL